MKQLFPTSLLTRSSRLYRIKLGLRACITALGLALCIASIPAHAGTGNFVVGDIYVYTSPGVVADVTAEYHEDPVIILNGIQVEIYPNYSNGTVYDASGDILGFIYGVNQNPPL